MIGDTFVCAACGETFTKECSEDDVAAEALALFGEIPAGQGAMVCDECWQRMGLGAVETWPIWLATPTPTEETP